MRQRSCRDMNRSWSQSRRGSNSRPIWQELSHPIRRVPIHPHTSTRGDDSLIIFDDCSSLDIPWRNRYAIRSKYLHMNSKAFANFDFNFDSVAGFDCELYGYTLLYTGVGERVIIQPIQIGSEYVLNITRRFACNFNINEEVRVTTACRNQTKPRWNLVGALILSS